MLQSQSIPIEYLECNTGQIDGLPKNPRFLKDEAFKSLVRSLEQDPDMLELREVIAYPLAKNKYVVLGGNQRLMAGLELLMTEMPVKVVPKDTPLDKLKRIVIKDNGSWGNHDFDLLANEWSDLPLQDWGIDLPEDWLQEPETIPAEEEDFNAEPPKEPITVLGDLYELNGHRVLCGDSTDSDAVARLMDGNKADMVFTDPPYNAAFNGRSGKFDVIENDELPEAEFEEFIMNWWQTAQTQPVKEMYVCCDWKFMPLLFGLQKWRNCIVWAKNNFSMGRGYRNQHELIMYQGQFDSTTETNLWQIAKDTNYEHPTQKPPTIAFRAISNSSKKGNIVLDYFLGSHSTLLAGEQSNRFVYGQELDPQYVDLGLRRWVKYMRDNSRPYTVKRNGQTLTEEQIKEYFPK